MRRAVTISLLLGAVALPLPLSAEVPLEQRLLRLERQFSSQALLEMMNQLQRQQREIQQLRGTLEEQAHAIDNLLQRQRELYQDTDRRLLRLERDGGGVAAPVSDEPAVAFGTLPSTISTEQGVATDAAVVTSSDSVGDGAAVAPQQGDSTAPSSVADASLDAPPIAVDPAREREDYQAAFELLKQLRYDQAITAFRQFLEVYPEGRYSAIAQYWLGEANYTQRHYSEAIKEYQRLVDNYPQSRKLPEAMLKIGYSHFELGDKLAARAALEQLLQRHPETTEAAQAAQLLPQLTP